MPRVAGAVADGELATAVTGAAGPLAHPALVCDVAIGQTTLVTQRVKANLFYRGLVFHRFPVIGDTLFTRTEVVGLKENTTKPGRARTGLAALRMTTVDDLGRRRHSFRTSRTHTAAKHLDSRGVRRSTTRGGTIRVGEKGSLTTTPQL